MSSTHMCLTSSTLERRKEDMAVTITQVGRVAHRPRPGLPGLLPGCWELHPSPELWGTAARPLQGPPGLRAAGSSSSQPRGSWPFPVPGTTVLQPLRPAKPVWTQTLAPALWQKHPGSLKGYLRAGSVNSQHRARNGFCACFSLGFKRRHQASRFSFPKTNKRKDRRLLIISGE